MDNHNTAPANPNVEQSYNALRQRGVNSTEAYTYTERNECARKAKKSPSFKLFLATIAATALVASGCAGPTGESDGKQSKETDIDKWLANDTAYVTFVDSTQAAPLPTVLSSESFAPVGPSATPAPIIETIPEPTEAPITETTLEPTEAPIAETATPIPEAQEAPSHGEFISDGFVETKNGAIERIVYEPGSVPDEDPYATKFQHQNEPGYENDAAYGTEIAGDTEAEITSNWLKEVAKSSEAVTRLRVQMGLEPALKSLKDENRYANDLDTLKRHNPQEYAKVVNETLGEFYNRIDGGRIEVSYGWVLENYMADETPGDHSDPELHGRFNGDDDQGNERDTLLTFYDKDGNNIISAPQGFKNTYAEAVANSRTNPNVGYRVYINVREGGTWKWKAYTIQAAPTSTPSPTTKPKDEGNMSRIDEEINSNISNDIGTGRIDPGNSSQPGDATGQPTQENYNNTVSHNEATNHADANEIPVNNAPVGGSDLDDILANLGI